MNIFPVPAPAAAGPGVVRARLCPPSTDYTPAEETLEFFDAHRVYGVLFLPRDAAHDVVSRLEDVPASITHVDRRTAGHVRYVLDLDYKAEADRPPPWLGDLIMLISTAPEEERRRLGRIYPPYVVAAAIGTGPGGIEALRRWHESLPADLPDTRLVADG